MMKFPKDRNCEICKRTKITIAPCRRRKGEAVPRAEKFGDLITADHKVLSDNCESRNNHRYAVVVQDLATQWIQAYPCKNKTSQETQRSLQKFLEPERKPKVIYTDNSLEFGKACEDLSWNHCTSTPHRSETNGIAERAVRRVKEGTSAVLLQSGLNESWWARFYVRPICETSQIYYLMGRRPMKDVLGNHLKDLLFHSVTWLMSACRSHDLPDHGRFLLNALLEFRHWLTRIPPLTVSVPRAQLDPRVVLARSCLDRWHGQTDPTPRMVSVDLTLPFDARIGGGAKFTREVRYVFVCSQLCCVQPLFWRLCVG